MSVRYAVFCADPLNPKAAEPDFTVEVAAAREAGFSPVLIEHDALDHRLDAKEAVRNTRITEPGSAIYRGWMLSSEAYRALHDELLTRGVRLLTAPGSYDACHHTPGSYDALKAFMPDAVWVTKDKLDDKAAIHEALAHFGASAVVIKDWVKSQAAGYWADACFIPDARATEQASGVVERFRELQGDSLVGGVVFKHYEPLLPLGQRADEYRAFVVRGQPVGCWPRSQAASNRSGPTNELLREVASKVPSPFASADFGVDGEGKWWLLEVGDGQVSGLPSDAAAKPLYQALAETA